MRTIILFIFIFAFLTGCQSVKDGLTLQKKTGADEFLVKKKNPLVLPPEFNELPLPENAIQKNTDTSLESIEELLNKNNKKSEKLETGSKSTKVEQSVLDKIKN